MFIYTYTNKNQKQLVYLSDDKQQHQENVYIVFNLECIFINISKTHCSNFNWIFNLSC